MTEKQITEFLTGLTKDLQPIIQVGIGAWIGAYFAGRNSFRLLKIQHDQQLDEWKRDKETKEREALKAWFEDVAITKCVDPLLREAFLLKNLVASQEIGKAELIASAATQS